MPFQNPSLFRVFLLMAFLFFVGTSAFAQKTREQLEREKSENQGKIREIQSILKQTSSQKNVNLGQLKALNQQINTYKKQIDLLSDDLELLDRELKVLEKKRQELDNSLAKLKEEYGHMIYEASKRNVYFNQLVFLFSSGTFNQFVLRYKYLKQYTDARKGQVKEMEVLQEKLTAERRRITSKQNQQKTVLDTRITENTKLEGLKTKQNEVIQELSQKEVELRKQIAENKRATDLLEANIRRIAERERRERIERERKEREEREARRRAERKNSPGKCGTREKRRGSSGRSAQGRRADCFERDERRRNYPGFLFHSFPVAVTVAG